MKLVFIYLQFIIYSCVALAQGLPSIVLDPSSGNYIITYIGSEGDTIQTFFEPATKINAEITCAVSFDSSEYNYNYTLYNGSSSQQRLLTLSVDFFSDLILVNRPDSNWFLHKFKNYDIRNWTNSTSSYGAKSPWNGIAPDSSQDGFSMVSLGLPTILNCYLRGASSTLFFPEEPSIDVIELLKPLRNFPNNTIIEKTIGPIDPPDPFVPLNFIDTLINYTDDAFDLDWIANQTTADKYEDLFDDAKTLIQGNHIPWVDSTLYTVLEELDDDSSGNVTSEAYALLRYNTEYLLDNLPAVIAPVLNSLSPSLGFPSGAFSWYDMVTATVTGDLFTDSSVVYFDGQAKTTTYISDSSLTFPLLSFDIRIAGNYPVWVSNYGVNSDTIYFSAVDTLPQPVIPVLNCVRDNGDRTFTAFFGYNNQNNVGVYIAVGDENKFSNPSQSYRGQPKVFFPGIQTNIFSVDFDGDDLTWNLNGTSVKVNKKSTPCPE